MKLIKKDILVTEISDALHRVKVAVKISKATETLVALIKIPGIPLCEYITTPRTKVSETDYTRYDPVLIHKNGCDIDVHFGMTGYHQIDIIICGLCDEKLHYCGLPLSESKLFSTVSSEVEQLLKERQHIAHHLKDIDEQLEDSGILHEGGASEYDFTVEDATECGFGHRH